MDSLQALFESSPFLASVLPPLATALCMALLYSYAGSGWLSGVLQLRGVTARRSAFDKCALQVAHLGVVLGWLLLVGGRIWIFFNADSYVPRSFLGHVIETAWGALGIAVVLTSLHYGLWKTLAGHRTLHAMLGLLSGLAGILALAAVMGGLRLLCALELPNAAELNLEDLFNFRMFPSPLLYASLAMLPLALAMPAAASLCWLLWRRRRDDYGRDYYSNMVPRLAKWALAAGAAAAAVYLFTVCADMWQIAASGAFELSLEEAVTYALRFLPLAIACVLWAVVWRSSQPLRRKPEIIVAFLLCFASCYFIFSDATSFVF
jgi:hypothetical protein